jgi:hypothetical protein
MNHVKNKLRKRMPDENLNSYLKMKVISYKPKTERLAMQQQQQNKKSQRVFKLTVRLGNLYVIFIMQILLVSTEKVSNLSGSFTFITVLFSRLRARALCHLRPSETLNSNKDLKMAVSKKQKKWLATAELG